MYLLLALHTEVPAGTTESTAVSLSPSTPHNQAHKTTGSTTRDQQQDSPLPENHSDYRSAEQKIKELGRLLSVLR